MDSLAGMTSLAQKNTGRTCQLMKPILSASDLVRKRGCAARTAFLPDYRLGNMEAGNLLLAFH